MTLPSSTLVISLAGIGDTLLATPLIAALSRSAHSGPVDVLVMWPGARDLLGANPHVRETLLAPMLDWGMLRSLRFLLGLRRRRYTSSFNTYPQSKIHYACVAWCVGAASRVGHRYEGAHALGKYFLTRTVPQDYQLHGVENNLQLLGQPLDPGPHSPQLYLEAPHLDWASQFIGKLGAGPHWLLGAHVGSGRTKNLALRRWPLDQYCIVFKEVLACRPEGKVLLFGGKDEAEDIEEVLRSVGSDRVVAVPAPSLRHAGAVIQKCDAFLSVDTALMHVAAAVQVPCQVVIETPTFNKTVEPYGRPYSLVSNPAIAGNHLQYYRYDGRGIRGSKEGLERLMRAVTPAAVLASLAGRNRPS